MLDGRLRFVDRDCHVGNAVEGEAAIGNASGHRLDEVTGIACENLHHGVRDLRIVHRGGEFIRTGVDDESQIDIGYELLAVPAFLGEDPVESDGGQSGDGDPIDDASSLAGWDAKCSCVTVPHPL